jgi:Secretion system C-terminal sorting domain
MKTKLLVLLTLFTLLSFGQSPINSFYVDDNAVFALVSSNTAIDQTASGPNQVWNFDQLVQFGTSNYTKMTPTPDEILTFPNTNSVVLSTSNTLTATTSQMFVKDIASVISITGLRAAGLELNFSTNNATLGAFPMNYGYTNTDPVSGTYIYTTYSGTFTGNIVTSVDAYGTLYRNVGGVPNSNATRLKTVITISLNYGFFTNVGTITQTTYSYYQNPLISSDGLLFRTATTSAVVPLASIDQTDVSMESYLATTLSTESEDFITNQIQIAPNPITDRLNLHTNESIIPQSITIVDSSGRVVTTLGIKEKSIDVSQLQKGIYLAKITTNKGIVTKKIIKE